jgi:hypothetical protein
LQSVGQNGALSVGCYVTSIPAAASTFAAFELNERCVSQIDSFDQIVVNDEMRDGVQSSNFKEYPFGLTGF